MTNKIVLPPLPEPDWVLEVRQWLRDRNSAHAAAELAAKDARIKVLEDQLVVAAMQLTNALGYIEEARAALGDKT